MFLLIPVVIGLLLLDAAKKATLFPPTFTF